MKTASVLCLVILMSRFASAQKLKESEVPEAVKKAFNQKFSGAKEVKWSKESATEFEAEFEVGEQEQSATFLLVSGLEPRPKSKNLSFRQPFRQQSQRSFLATK